MTEAGFTIYEVLAHAGIERGRDKMVCSVCQARKVTASEPKGIAKCWGCGAFWSVKGDYTSSDRDWAIDLIGAIASRCQDHLPKCIEALDWLDHRRLPTKDAHWLADQDLGAVPPGLYFNDLVSTARNLLNETSALRQGQVNLIVAAGKGKSAKARRGAEAKVEGILNKIDSDKTEFEHFVEGILPLLKDPAWRNAIVYVYRDEDGLPCSLNIRQYATEPAERKVMRLQPRTGRRGVFGAGDANYLVGEAWSNKIPALTVFEGEHNLLALRANVEKWGLDYFIPAIAIGGKNGADVDCVKALARADEPLIVFDHDKVNPATGRSGGYELVDAVSARMYCQAATTPTKDMDDYIRANENLTPANLYNDVFSLARKVPLKIETVRDVVAEHLTAGGFEANAREIAVTGLIVRDVKRRAQLYSVDGYAMLLFPSSEITTNQIAVRKGNPMFHELMRQYGISKPDWVDACGKAINIEAGRLDTPRRTLHAISAWLEGKLYINCYEGSMVRISVVDNKSIVQRVPVGTDGVLMQRYAHSLDDTESETRPWLDPKLDLGNIAPGSLRHRAESHLELSVLARVNYMEQPEHFKQLLKCWILSTFFSTTQKSKPVPMIEGNGGGGKTTLGVAVGNILIGERFSATNAPCTANELAELMTGVPFVVFDEWDAIPKEVEKAFKHLTTGGKHRRRELYTTSSIVELSCDATIMLTTNSNPTREVATSRRFLVIPVAPRQKEAGERVFHSVGDHLLPRLMAARNAIWSELLADLSACVLALHNTDAATKTSLSMADFGVFVQRIAEYEDWGDLAIQMLLTTEKKQEQQSAEKQVIAELLTELFVNNPGMQGHFYTAHQWADHLQTVISEHDYDNKRKVTPNYVNYTFKTFADLYKRLFMMTDKFNLRTKIKEYALQMPAAEVVDEPEAV